MDRQTKHNSSPKTNEKNLANTHPGTKHYRHHWKMERNGYTANNYMVTSTPELQNCKNISRITYMNGETETQQYIKTVFYGNHDIQK